MDETGQFGSQYAPKSRILFVTIDSHNKQKGGNTDYQNECSLLHQLTPKNREYLIATRKEVREQLLSGKIEFDGLPLSYHDFNQNLVDGKDFGGNDSGARYLPSIDRYDGRFFFALGKEGVENLIRSGHHLLLISGMYGLSTPFEPVQLYSCPIVRDSDIQKLWREGQGLSPVLEEYIAKHRIRVIFDLTARYEWRDQIDWDHVIETTGVKVLHCISNMGNEEDGLIPFGKLLRNNLFKKSEEELLRIREQTTIDGISFRRVAKPMVGDPDFSLDEWARTIPFPLASILWRYLADPKPDEDALNHLLQFFEAFSRFHATVLLSGFSNDSELFEQIKSKKENYLTFRNLKPINNMSFGSWNSFNKILIDAGNRMLSGKKEEKQRIKEMFCTQNTQTLKMLFSNDIKVILKTALDFRNEKSHEGLQNEEIVQERVLKLRNLLIELKYCVSTHWENYRLLLAGDMKYRNEVFSQKAKVLMKTSYPFREDEFELDEQMETDSLYLYDRNEKRALRLLPLVAFHSHPQLACYFYNNIDGSNVCWVSYHYDSKPKLLIESPDTAEAVQTISQDASPVNKP